MRQQATWDKMYEKMERRDAEEGPAGDLDFGSEDKEVDEDR